MSVEKGSELLVSSDVIVATAEIIRMGLVDQGWLNPTDLSLVVFDECHNGVGNHPMAAIMRDSILRTDPKDRPRTVGLTGSFINGALTNIVEKRAALEALFNATLFTCDCDSDLGDEKTFTKISAPYEDLEAYRDTVVPVIEDVLFESKKDLGKDYSRFVSRGFAVFVGLGVDGLRVWLREGVLSQLAADYEAMKARATYDPVCAEIANRFEAFLPRTESLLREKLIHLNFPVQPELPPPPKLSQKLICLLKLLWTLVGDPGSPSSNTRSRGIVFVEQVAMTYPLAFLVNHAFSQMKERRELEATAQESVDSTFIRSEDEEMHVFSSILQVAWTDYSAQNVSVETMLPVSGATTMSDALRSRNLEAFRNGHVPLLVSTNALEEGIDVPECDFIVRFDSFATTKSHIQGSGRAREKERLNAEIMEEAGRSEFCKWPEEGSDDRLQNDVNDVAGTIGDSSEMGGNDGHSLGGLNGNGGDSFDLSYALLDGGDRNSVTETNSPSMDMEPIDYRGTWSGLVVEEIDFFNSMYMMCDCVPIILNQWIDVYSLFQRQTDTYLILSVHYPTPSGFLVLYREDVDKFWAECNTAEVIRPLHRYKRLYSLERDELRAAYVVLVKLRELGLLAASNESLATEALSKTNAACDHMLKDGSLILDSSFQDELQRRANGTGGTSIETSDDDDDDDDEVGQSSGLWFSGRKQVYANSDFLEDYKSMLFKIIQQDNRGWAVNELVKYRMYFDHVFQCYKCVVKVERCAGPLSKQTATGDRCRTKKAAERSASYELLHKLNLA
eukprot:gene1116-1256_t